LTGTTMPMRKAAMTDERSDKGIVVVTGGAGGIGAATASVIAGKGYRVVSLDIRGADAATSADIVHHWPDPVDVCDANAVSSVFSAIESDLGPVCGLVNAAGILGRMDPPENIQP